MIVHCVKLFRIFLKNSEHFFSNDLFKYLPLHTYLFLKLLELINKYLPVILMHHGVGLWCSGYYYCITSFIIVELRFCIDSNLTCRVSEVCYKENHSLWGGSSPTFLRHPPLDPACPPFLKSLFPLSFLFHPL